MIKVSVFYPNEKGKEFDMEYYCNKHIPMVQEKLGSQLKGLTVEHGLDSGEPGSEPIYTAMAHLNFDSVETFQSAFGPHTDSIMGDLPNFTGIQPVIQISEVKIK